MSQRDNVLRMLRQGPTCGVTFLNAHIPRYAARIHELRKRGYEISRRECRQHYHTSRQYEFVLDADRSSLLPSSVGTRSALEVST